MVGYVGSRNACNGNGTVTERNHFFCTIDTKSLLLVVVEKDVFDENRNLHKAILNKLV